ncbi:MAG: flagellar basal-body rod protein FlgF [Candidatus Acidulodesulfobacterium ferriphilum]|jgi:flagellar basal-body rod protein FlgF|uniref:Flagellar basal-body rod protein FlgF n=1 Tax=Candidatus Acidulodesulfobacterium ferriphilum TaxID=2597223 RepID=A0A519BBE5_9DELT|nr:MAG: flagellar basal-body rod protein FlgF [Candidatus Acidulodesulfobacterium ferriphilum]
MNGGSYVALSGIIAEGQKLNMITNNLANANTVGYKSSGSLFGEFLSRKAIQTLDSKSFKPFVDKAYPVTLNSYINNSQGPLKKTGNRLDLAINGDGFFVLQTPDGIKFTRNGVFSLNSAGELVNQNGFPVLNIRKRPIFLNERGSNITITKNGIINLTDPLTNNEMYYGQILTVNFNGPKYLSKYGDTMFSATKNSGAPALNKNPDILQGYVEESNVNEIRDMAEMINVSQVHNNMVEVLKSYSNVNNTTINTIGAAV